MITRHAPELVSPTLIELTRALGEPERDLVILAEGNTSEMVSPTEIVVKTSGASMGSADVNSFVAVDAPALLDLLRDDRLDQAALSRALSVGEGRQAVKASIETLIHVAARSMSPSRFVAHTHPTAVISLVASAHAQDAFADPVYSEEYMVLGKPLFVPYAQPGIELGRLFLRRWTDYCETHGEAPSFVLLGNHGMVAISDSAAGIEAISAMAVKSARVRLGAAQWGPVTGLGAEVVAHYFDRGDFRERRRNLAGITIEGAAE